MSDTLFKKVDYDLDSLVKFIELGQIGLPDIQRPFVWPNKKVRDLFDSMYRGYPVGYLLFWQNGFGSETKQIGMDHKQKVPRPAHRRRAAAPYFALCRDQGHRCVALDGQIGGDPDCL